MAEVVSKVVTRFACSVCHRSWASKRRAAQHVDHCPHDPASRACATCRHDGDRDDPGCHIGMRPGGLPCIYQCSSWEPTREFVTNTVEVFVTDKPAEAF